MGDKGDGSSSAAQSAPQNQTEERPGLLARLGLGFRPKVTNGATGETVQGVSAPEPTVLGMLNLRRMRVEDVAVPKTDIVAVPLTISKDDLVKTFRDSGMTRLPVYDTTLDTPVGIANLKDFALRYGFNGGNADLDLRDMLRPLLFVPPSMPLSRPWRPWSDQMWHWMVNLRGPGTKAPSSRGRGSSNLRGGQAMA